MPYFRHATDLPPERLQEIADAAFDPTCTCAMCSPRMKLQEELNVFAYSTAADAHANKYDDQKVTFICTDQERRAWQRRECDRFLDGSYQPVPWSEHEDDRTTGRYPHLSLNDPGMIAFTKSDEHGFLDRQTRVKPGRYLREYFPTWSDDQVREYAESCNGKTLELRIATSTADIVRVYLGGPDSCMSHADSDYESSVHPVSVYGESDLAVAYYGSIDRASARAIVWPARKKYGRLYGGTSTLRELLHRAGYQEGSMRGARVQAIRDDNGYVMPYVDHCQGASLSRDGKWIILGDGPIACDCTNGISAYSDDDEDDGWTCSGCDNTYTDDGSMNTFNGSCYCSDCYDDRFGTCAYCNNTYRRTALTSAAADGSICEDCIEARSESCVVPDCSNTFCSDTIDNRPADVDHICGDCESDYYYCADCQRAIAREDEDGPIANEPSYASACTTCGSPIRCPKTLDLLSPELEYAHENAA